LYFISINFNIVPSPMPTSSTCPLPFTSSDEKSVCISSAPHACYTLSISHLNFI
jgi:hypothetical protein